MFFGCLMVVFVCLQLIIKNIKPSPTQQLMMRAGTQQINKWCRGSLIKQPNMTSMEWECVGNVRSRKPQFLSICFLYQLYSIQGFREARAHFQGLLGKRCGTPCFQSIPGPHCEGADTKPFTHSRSPEDNLKLSTNLCCQSETTGDFSRMKLEYLEKRAQEEHANSTQ